MLPLADGPPWMVVRRGAAFNSSTLLLDALLGRKAAMEIDEHLLADSEIGLDWIDFETAVRMELGPTRFPI